MSPPNPCPHRFLCHRAKQMQLDDRMLVADRLCQCHSPYLITVKHSPGPRHSCLLLRRQIASRASRLHSRRHNTSRTSRCTELRGALECSAGHANGQTSVSPSRRLCLGLFTAAAALGGSATSGEATLGGGESFLEKRVSEFTLSNGLHFIVLERHTAPVVSCHTFANVGAYEEEDERTGLAHMLEHEAFKGTRRIGTTDWRREAPLLEAQDEVFYSILDEQRRGRLNTVEQLSQKLLRLQQEASQYSIPNDFGARLSQAGAVGLNASTSHDSTRYVTSIPSNVLELWFALESERFQDPVFRELYSEKRVVLEERSARVDNSALGRFQEGFNSRAFANAYSRPVIGSREDIERFGRREVEDFFQRFYGPRNITVAIVGDASPDKVLQFATKYFGQWSPNTQPVRDASQIDSAKPAASSGKFERAAAGGPGLMKAFYRPAVISPDAVILDVIGEVLVGSRTARLERKFVQTGKAYSASFLPAFPGDKHPCAAMTYVIPTKGFSLEQTESSLDQELAALASEGVTEKELQRIKKAAKLDLIEAIRFNSSLAGSLCSYHALTGSWKTVLDDLSIVDTLTSEKIRATSERIFSKENSFTGYVLSEGSRQVRQQPLPVV